MRRFVARPRLGEGSRGSRSEKGESGKTSGRCLCLGRGLSSVLGIEFRVVVGLEKLNRERDSMLSKPICSQAIRRS